MAVIPFKILGEIPVRLNLWIMMFTCCWMAYMLRVNMSLNIIAMVKEVERLSSSSSNCIDPKNEVIKNTTLRHEDISDVKVALRSDGERFDWSTDQQALILGAYFWSYPVTSLVGGMIAERWGPRYVVLISTLLSAILTALSPIASKLHYIALIVVRFLLGATGGVVYPALHALIARWVPPVEKGKFVSSMMGGTLGAVVTWSLTGPLIEKCGWESAFYIPAVLAFVWCGFWWFLVADLPSEHPRITDSEKKYITDAIGDKVTKVKGMPPLMKIATSFPFLAMVVLHFGNLWGLYFIMTVGPKFVSSVLGFQLSAAGVISALPNLARLFLAATFGVIGDYILSKNIMTTKTIRKFFCLFSHIIPGLLLIVMIYAGCSTALSVALITMSMGSNGAATLTNLQNHQDLAPNYAGTLYGIANAIGSTTGFFTPLITAYFTRNGNGFEQWRPVFFIGASVYIITALFFILFGSVEIQPWNAVGNEDEKPKNGDLRKDKDTPLSVIS